MFTSVESMKRQVGYFIDSLKGIRGNLVRAMPNIEKDRTLAIYFIGKAFNEFIALKATYQSVSPKNEKIDELIKSFNEFQNAVDNYVEFSDAESESDLIAAFRDIYNPLDDLEVYLLDWLEKND